MNTKVLITIDTEVRNEGRHLEDAFDRYVLGKVNNGDTYGCFWISDEIKKHGLVGDYYIDVYASAEFKNMPYAELCRRLLDEGHSLQLHTHPDRMYDRNRLNMHEYSLVEQTEIISTGISLMKQWTGKRPVGHRAGRYGADENTLIALQKNKLLYDSSFFFRRENCKLSFPNSNEPSIKHGVVEVPVTTVKVPIIKKGFRFPQWTIPIWRLYYKLDVNAMSGEELCRAVLSLKGKVPYIVTFLHSFSFVKRTADGFAVDEKSVNSFKSLLSMLEKKNIPVITLDDVKDDYSLANNPK